MIYLDAAVTQATTPDVRERMNQILSQTWGNVSGGHAVSREAKDVLEKAREKVASICDVAPDKVVFTSGSTEALNLVIQGYTNSHRDAKIFCSLTEHPAVYKTVKNLEEQGREVVYMPVDSQGVLDENFFENIQPGDLVCVMAVNNEIGVINDLSKIAEVVKSKGAKLLVDAVQSFYTFLPNEITALADYIVFSGHKLGSPQGVGVLIIGDRKSISPINFGGSQEWELRPGTTPAFLCDSFAYVLEREINSRQEAINNVVKCKKEFIDGLKELVPDCLIHAENAPTSPHVVSVHFEGIESQMMLTMLDSRGVYVSKGSACASGASTASRVLLSLGLEEERAQSTLRFSFSRHTDVEEVRQAAEIVADCVNQLTRTLLAGTILAEGSPDV